MLLTGQQLGGLCPEMCLGREQELLSWSVNVTASIKPHACRANTLHARAQVTAVRLLIFFRFLYSDSQIPLISPFWGRSLL